MIARGKNGNKALRHKGTKAQRHKEKYIILKSCKVIEG